ncbi:MAG: stimulus-sensing domain-containing protein [Hyphomicrobiaceae bacterium]
MRKRPFWHLVSLIMLPALIISGLGTIGFGGLFNSLVDLKSETLRAQADILAIFLVTDGPLEAERAAPVLRRLVPGPRTRARLYARDGLLLVDTAGGLGPRNGGSGLLAETRSRLTYWLRERQMPPVRETSGPDDTIHPEVRTALSGSVATLVVMENGEQIVLVATPILRRAAIEGVLLLSTRAGT